MKSLHWTGSGTPYPNFVLFVGAWEGQSQVFINGSGGASRQAHVIVCGNEKGGSGKTTTAMHIAVYLLNAGYKVGTIDLDVRQATFSSYVENRKRSAALRRGGPAHTQLRQSQHFIPKRGQSDSIASNEHLELESFSSIVAKMEAEQDFIVVDTPGHDNYLMRLAHSMADTLVTPLNDSYIDFDVLGKVDPMSGELLELSHYAQMVRSARRQRRQVDNGLLDWIIVRNRMSHLVTNNERALEESLKDLAMRLGCRLADGISERVIFRELFPVGLTAMDEPQAREGHSTKSTLSHLSARHEIGQLIKMLRLPIDAAGRKRADARQAWLTNAAKPVDMPAIFAE